MPPKALSSSTLSLRFMQNAEQKHTVQQAKVRDDAEWELPQDLRSTTVGEDTVTYEHSYLPFLFDQPRGRRTFDKHGKEVSASTDPPVTLPLPAAGAGTTNSKKPPRPKTISSFGSDVKKEKDTDPSKSAKYAIRDISGVGTDLRTTAFMKPEGVDLPVSRAIKKEDGTEGKSKKKRALDAGAASTVAGEKKPKLRMIE